jgi:hypothetical protein
MNKHEGTGEYAKVSYSPSHLRLPRDFFFIFFLKNPAVAHEPGTMR